jgi:hypothetical protein
VTAALYPLDVLIDDVIETLKSFNAKIERLDRPGFAKEFENQLPGVIVKFKSPNDFENYGDGSRVQDVNLT